MNTIASASELRGYLQAQVEQRIEDPALQQRLNAVMAEMPAIERMAYETALVMQAVFLSLVVAVVGSALAVGWGKRKARVLIPMGLCGFSAATTTLAWLKLWNDPIFGSWMQHTEPMNAYKERMQAVFLDIERALPADEDLAGAQLGELRIWCERFVDYQVGRGLGALVVALGNEPNPQMPPTLPPPEECQWAVSFTQSVAEAKRFLDQQILPGLRMSNTRLGDKTAEKDLAAVRRAILLVNRQNHPDKGGDRAAFERNQLLLDFLQQVLNVEKALNQLGNLGVTTTVWARPDEFASMWKTPLPAFSTLRELRPGEKAQLLFRGEPVEV